MTVRRIAESDRDAIRELDERVFRPSDQYDSEMYGRLLSDPALQTYVAIDQNDALVGYALLDVSTEPARLRSLAVDPDHRRVGYATALIREALKGCTRAVDLFVEPENDAAIRLYERFGFVRVADSDEMPTKNRMLRRHS